MVPITHRETEGRTVALEIPAEIYRRVGPNGRRQWAIESDGKEFVSPDPGLWFITNFNPPSVTYGTVPRRFFALVSLHMQTLMRAMGLATSLRR